MAGELACLPLILSVFSKVAGSLFDALSAALAAATSFILKA